MVRFLSSLNQVVCFIISTFSLAEFLLNITSIMSNTFKYLFGFIYDGTKYLQCRNVIKILRMVQWNFDGCCDWQADIAGTSQKQSLEYLLINATLSLLLNCFLKFKAIRKLPLVNVMYLEQDRIAKREEIIRYKRHKCSINNCFWP